jgi:hypothetical protein
LVRKLNKFVHERLYTKSHIPSFPDQEKARSITFWTRYARSALSKRQARLLAPLNPCADVMIGEGKT